VGALDKAIKIKSSTEFLVRRGLCKHGLKDADGEIKDYEQAVSSDDKSAAAHYYLGRALVAKDRAKAIEQLSKAAELDPTGGTGKRAKAELDALKAPAPKKGKK
jgi:tetratricopeptide (TPR) repeat protein